MKYALTFDSTPSVRTKDENGFLHVALTPISKATVNPYLGKEIEGSKEHGFEPDKIYYGLRDPDELAKGAGTFNGLPLLLEHHPTDAENLPKEWVVGSMGTDAVFEKPYLKNSLTVTDAQAIQYIEDGTAKEISCSYRFTPDFTAGEYTEADGSKVHYDFIMRDIKGNHVALVPEGRAGHDVKVADGIDAVKYIANEERRSNMPIDDFIAKFMPLASDEEKAAAKAALEALAPAKDAEPTFAEGVAFGEKLEKEEPKKLDSEHESEGMEKKLDGDEAVEEVKDACGKDEELPVDEENLDELMKDPKFKAAYEMGVRYGEKREKADPEKIDADHEREGMERALGEDSVKAIEKRITDKLRSINDAAKKVRPLVGEIANPFAFDSADSVYKFALEKNGKDVKKYPASAYEGMVDMILENKPVVAEDSAMSGDIGGADEFMKALKKIRK
jgi:hypothetical protein